MQDTTVRSFMTPAPETVQPGDVLALAEEKMRRGRFRRLPVVDAQGRLLGILSDGDLRAHGGYLESTRVTAAMVENPCTVSAEAPIEEAVEKMLERGIGGLPVLDGDGNLAGIVTESDVLRGFLALLRTGGLDAAGGG